MAVTAAVAKIASKSAKALEEEAAKTSSKTARTVTNGTSKVETKVAETTSTTTSGVLRSAASSTDGTVFSKSATRSSSSTSSITSLRSVVKDSDNIASKKALLGQSAETEPNMARILSTEKQQSNAIKKAAINNNVESAVPTTTVSKVADDVNPLNNEKVLSNSLGDESAKIIDNFSAKLDDFAESLSKVSTKKSSGGLAVAGIAGGALIGTALAAPTLLSVLQSPAGEDLLPEGSQEGQGNENDNLLIGGEVQEYDTSGYNPSFFYPDGSSSLGDGSTVYVQGDGYSDDSSSSSSTNNTGIPAIIRDAIDNVVETIQDNPIPTAIIAAIIIIAIASASKNKKGKKTTKTAKAGGNKA